MRSLSALGQKRTLPLRMSAFTSIAHIARYALPYDSGVPTLLMADYMDAAKCLGGRVLEAEPKGVGGDLDALLSWQRDIESGALLGPHLVVAGPFIAASGRIVPA